MSVLSWNFKCVENSRIETFVTMGITAVVKCVRSCNFLDLKRDCASKRSRHIV